MTTVKISLPARTIEVDVSALVTIASAFVVTRLMVFFIIYISSTVFPMRPGPFLYSDPNNLIMDGLVRDDSWWYQNIATHGYSMGDVATQVQGNAAFFPLYPILIKLVSAFTGNVFLAGILISNIAFFFALCYLYALARAEFDNETAARAVFYFAAAPTAVFFSAMYTESLFILFVVATFYYARQGDWVKAAIAGILASATRNTGVLMTFVIALEALHQNGVRWFTPNLTREALVSHYRQQIQPALHSWRGLVAACFVPLGLLAFMAYLTNRFGDPLGFIHVQATWGRQVSASGFTQLFSHTVTLLNVGPHPWAGQLNIETLMNILMTLAFLPLVIATFFQLRPAYVVYATLTFVIPLSTGSVGSMTRYILMLVPCFLLLAKWGKRPLVDRLVLGLSLPLLTYFTIVFSHWYFAG